MSKVYLSSTLLDLREERQAVIEWLVSAGLQPVHSYVADTENVRDSCLDDVAGCDLFVLILGHRLGYQPTKNNPKKRSITELEFREARKRKRPCLAFLRTSVPDEALSDVNDPAKYPLVQAFRAEVSEAVRPAQFSDQASLIAALSAGIQRLRIKESRLDSHETETVPHGGVSQQKGRWWSTLPGILTGAATLLAAVTGLITLYMNRDKPPAPVPQPAPATAVGNRQAEPARAMAEPPAKTQAKSQKVEIGDVGEGAKINIQQQQ